MQLIAHAHKNTCALYVYMYTCIMCTMCPHISQMIWVSIKGLSISATHWGFTPSIFKETSSFSSKVSSYFRLFFLINISMTTLWFTNIPADAHVK